MVQTDTPYFLGPLPDQPAPARRCAICQDSMNPHTPRLTCLTASAALLVACATPGTDPLPYQAPGAGQPSVQLTVAPPDALSRHDTEELFRHHVACHADGVASAQPMVLTKWSLSSERRPQVVSVPDGRVYFRYVRNGNSKSCHMNFSAQLEAGHAYALETTSASRGFLKGSVCLLGVVDITTGEPVALDQESAQPNFHPVCNKQLGERAGSVVARN